MQQSTTGNLPDLETIIQELTLEDFDVLPYFVGSKKRLYNVLGFAATSSINLADIREALSKKIETDADTREIFLTFAYEWKMAKIEGRGERRGIPLKRVNLTISKNLLEQYHSVASDRRESSQQNLVHTLRDLEDDILLVMQQYPQKVKNDTLQEGTYTSEYIRHLVIQKGKIINMNLRGNSSST